MAPRKMAPRKATQHLINTRPKRSQCPRCGAEVLSCYVSGEMTRLDPVHLTLLAEALHLCATPDGRTYEVPVLGRDRAIRRNTGMISRGLPAYGFIHPSHRCGVSWDGAYLDHREIFPVMYSGISPPF